MIKAVFFDVDGTLLSFKTHRISKNTKDALVLLQEQGIKVFVATGRSFEQVKNVLDFSFDGYITSNGASCYSADGSLLQQATLPTGDLENLVAYLKKYGHSFAVSYMTASGIYATSWSDALLNHFELIDVPKPEIKPLDDLLSTDVLQLTVYMKQNEEKVWTDRLMPHCEFTRWHDDFADVNNKEFNKATGVQAMLGYHGIDQSQSMAFGDGGNDLKMLQYVAYGVAMGNARPDVKAKVKYITDTVDADGVWKALLDLKVIGTA